MIKYKGGVKMVYPVHLDSKEKIEKISNLACKEPFDIWISSDMDMLNAKSLLGLYSIIKKRVYIVAEDNVNPNKFLKVVEKMVA